MSEKISLVVIAAVLMVVVLFCNNRGFMSNNILIDVGGIRNGYGINSFSSSINLRADSLGYSSHMGDDYYDESEGGDGTGNFSQPVGFVESSKWELNTPDPRYLELRPNNWTDTCYNYSMTKIPNAPVELCSANPKHAVRYLASSRLNYNDDITDSQFKKNQLVSKNGGPKAIWVPWSMTYNRI